MFQVFREFFRRLVRQILSGVEKLPHPWRLWQTFVFHTSIMHKKDTDKLIWCQTLCKMIYDKSSTVSSHCIPKDSPKRHRRKTATEIKKNHPTCCLCLDMKYDECVGLTRPAIGVGSLLIFFTRLGLIELSNLTKDTDRWKHHNLSSSDKNTEPSSNTQLYDELR